MRLRGFIGQPYIKPKKGNVNVITFSVHEFDTNMTKIIYILVISNVRVSLSAFVNHSECAFCVMAVHVK